MPEPIASAPSPNLTCSLDDDPAPSAQPEVAVSPQACSASDMPWDSPQTSSASALVRNFPRNDQAAFIASLPVSESTHAPGVFTLRPDQLDAQTGISRIQSHASLGDVQLTAGFDLLNANAHLGSLNGDGSRGENIGASATLLGGELSIDYRGWSLTVGVAASLGGSISSGEGRDRDGDGVRERCFAMSLGPFALGECDEL